MTRKALAQVAGLSYFIIFFAAIFANFLAVEAITKDPLGTLEHSNMLVRFGIIAFIVTTAFDVVVAWALNELFKEDRLSGLSTLFRMMHAAMMGVAVAFLVGVLKSTSNIEILRQVELFNTVWLIGLFFFGIHLMLLGKILKRPRTIALTLVIAGFMYAGDTAAHFLLQDYNVYSSLFLAIVAIPSIIGEMSLAVWLLLKGGQENNGKKREWMPG